MSSVSLWSKSVYCGLAFAVGLSACGHPDEPVATVSPGGGIAAGKADDAAPAGDVEAPRIVGGSGDAAHAFVVGVGDETQAFCSGTVISRRTVITAGHCYGSITRVYFGSDITDIGRAMSIRVSKEVRHPGFASSETSITNDLTMLLLAEDAPVQPAPLLRETLDNTSTYIGPKFLFVGYGVTDGPSQTGFGVRRSVEFPIAAVGPASIDGTSGKINATQFYYHAAGKNTCNGDSGGPAFVARGGIMRHAGVTSFGDGSCQQYGADARTDAPQIAKFIQPTIDDFENNDPCRADGVCNESCNTAGQLVDPDCAENHCGKDGICVLSCAGARDPDCVGGNAGSGGGSTGGGGNSGGDDATFIGVNDNAGAIPDNSRTGMQRSIRVPTAVTVNTVEVQLDIDHPWRGDLEVKLTSPSGTTVSVVPRSDPNDSQSGIMGTFMVDGLSGNGQGTWTLKVRDLAAEDTGTFKSWRLALNTTF